MNRCKVRSIVKAVIVELLAFHDASRHRIFEFISIYGDSITVKLKTC